MANRTRNGTTGRSAAQKTQSKGTITPDAPPKISATKDGGVAGANRRERKEEARRQREALLRKRARRRAVRIGTIAAVTILVVGLIVGIVIYRDSKPKAIVPQSQFPGLITTTDTRQWNTPNTQDMAARLKDMDMPPLGPENVTSHIHQELQILINGQQVPVPAFIGIDQTTQEFSEIHVHATDGVIHVESPTPRDFTLGNFFGVWGLNFTPTAIGGYSNGDGKELRVFVNGTQYTGDPTKMVLKAHQVIVVTFGTQAQIPSPTPKSWTQFDWANSTAGG
jgi:hypothetical protein